MRRSARRKNAGATNTEISAGQSTGNNSEYRNGSINAVDLEISIRVVPSLLIPQLEIEMKVLRTGAAAVKLPSCLG